MALAFHIIIALSSIVYTTYLFIAPSRRKLYVNYGLVSLTLASGVYLVISTHARLVPSCTTGLVYLSVITASTLGTRSKMAHAKAADR
jgi:hypothetical protein